MCLQRLCLLLIFVTITIQNTTNTHKSLFDVVHSIAEAALATIKVTAATTTSSLVYTSSSIYATHQFYSEKKRFITTATR